MRVEADASTWTIHMERERGQAKEKGTNKNLQTRVTGGAQCSACFVSFVLFGFFFKISLQRVAACRLSPVFALLLPSARPVRVLVVDAVLPPLLLLLLLLLLPVALPPS